VLINNATRLGLMGALIAAQVAARASVLDELVQRHGTRKQLLRWIRGLPPARRRGHARRGADGRDVRAADRSGADSPNKGGS
jgi:hypothetical protein